MPNEKGLPSTTSEDGAGTREEGKGIVMLKEEFNCYARRRLSLNATFSTNTGMNNAMQAKRF